MGSWLAKAARVQRTCAAPDALCLAAPSQAGDFVKELAERAVHGHCTNDALQREVLREKLSRVGHHLASPGHRGQACGRAILLLCLPCLVLSTGQALKRGSCSQGAH